MKDFIKPYYSKMKEYLQKGSSEDTDMDELAMEVRWLSDEFYNELEKRTSSEEYEFDGEKAVSGLFMKFDRYYGEFSHFIGRDPISHLAIKLIDDFCPINCPYSQDEFPDIQKAITTYISKIVKKTEDEFDKPFLSGKPHTKLSQDQIGFIVNNLIQISHSITDYVEHYDDGSWHGLYDCLFIIQYVFEKSVELTYTVAKGLPTDNLSYNIKEAFSYFITTTPDDLQELIDGDFDKLEHIIVDTTSFIERNNYHLCDKETWFRPIIFNFCLEGMRYALEQKI